MPSRAEKLLGIEAMHVVDQQIRVARRRMWVDRFLRVIGWWLFATLSVAAIAILIPKFWAIEPDGPLWLRGWLGFAAIAALAGGSVTTWMTGPVEEEVALEIDKRFGLKERLSSFRAMGETDAASDAGKALGADAQRVAERIDVRTEFPIRSRWHNALPLIPAAIACLLGMLIPDATRTEVAAANTKQVIQPQVEKSTNALKRKLEKQKRLAEQKGLKDAQAALRELEKGVEKLKTSKSEDKKTALVQLNKMATQLQKRRAHLGDSQKLKQQLNRLKSLEQGPADRLAKSMKMGDLSKAVKELEMLKQKLVKDQLSKKEKEQLAKQLRELSKMLSEAVENQQLAKEELQRQIQKQQQSGDVAKAAELQKKLDKLNAQQSSMDELAKLAKKMAQSSENLSDGDLQKAAEAIATMSESMGQMESMMSEMEMLDAAMQQLADAKSSMVCQQCDGTGCSMCQGGMSPASSMMSKMSGKGSKGDGQGQGDRDEAKTEKNLYDSRIRAQVTHGKGVMTGLVRGTNVPGDALREINAALISADQSNDDPLTGHKLNKQVRDHVREYFDRRSGNVATASDADSRHQETHDSADEP